MTVAQFRARLEQAKVKHQAVLTDEMVRLIDVAIEAAELGAYDLARQRLALSLELAREAVGRASA